MGKLTRLDITKLANLARLQLTEAEIVDYADELSKILQYVEILQTVDVSGLQPTNQVTGLTNITRPDEINDYGYQPQDLYDNLPNLENNHIRVKRMIV